jgi:hypothetical protein
MAFIYEINGQRVEFEKEPTQADIDEAARSLGTGFQQQTPPSPAQPVVQQAAMSAIKPVGTAVAAQAADAVKLAKIAGQVTPSIIGEALMSPIKTTKDLASAYVAGHPMFGQMTNTPLKAMPGAIARGVAGAVAAPESAFLMPYQMAAYEQEKIRQNPYAQGLEYNPYAQVQRGEYATQRQAGAANQRSAVANQRYGGLTADEQAILEKDRLNMQMRVQAAKRVLGQQ